MVPMGRIELPTSPLPRECSTTEPHGRILTYFCDNNQESGAGEGNRTLVVSLEGFCSTIELHPPGYFLLHRLSPGHCIAFWWRGLDSNQRRRKPTDLQSAPFSHSGTSPQRTCDYGLAHLGCQALSVAVSACAACPDGLASAPYGPCLLTRIIDLKSTLSPYRGCWGKAFAPQQELLANRRAKAKPPSFWAWGFWV